MNIQLKQLALRNFKGIKEIKIDFKEETYIYGDNATGKTTIFDSFTWLLFGKDSANRADFNIKTLDANGEPLHGLEHEVTGLLNIDGKDVILKRILKENWVKKRGSADSVFSGNVTEYFVNEEPKKEKDYKAYIDSIIDENTFKLLTNPQYFNVNTKWQDRRVILLKIVGDITDEDVINSNVNLSKLLELLDGKTIDALKAILASKKKMLNEKLKAIPIRIDEVNRNLPVLAENVDFEALKVEKAKVKHALDIIENRMTSQRKIAEDFIKKQQELSAMKSKLQNMEFQIEKDSMQDLNNAKMSLMQFENDRKMMEQKIENSKKAIEIINEQIVELDKEAENLRIQYAEQFEAKFIEPDRDNFICPTCKQHLPEDNIEEKIKSMHEDFKIGMAKELERIKQLGKSKVDTKNKLIDGKVTRNEEIKQYEFNLAEIDGMIAIHTSQIATEEANKHEVNYLSNADYASIKTQIMAFEKELVPLDDEPKVNTDRVINENRLAEINEILSSKETLENAQERIKELKKEERTLSQQVAELEGQEFLTEEFTRAKVSMLEEKINKVFKYVTFKMFKTQVNGGLDDCCEAMVEGTPYQDVNTAGRLNAGLDIIRALSEFYDTYCPVFIDGRESINEIINIDSQVINLIVSAKGKSLRVEAL